MQPAIIRPAQPHEAPHIAGLYHHVYRGTYPDTLMTDLPTLEHALGNPGYLWMVATAPERSDRIIGSVVYQVDTSNRLAKVFGAVVHPDWRGSQLTERLMTQGRSHLLRWTPPIEVIYATTRTVTAAPQRITAKLGYQTTGIFPNVHKTDRFETHSLVVWISPEARHKRARTFRQHDGIAPLYNLTQQQTGLPPMQQEAPSQESLPWRVEPLPLECIQAPHFVRQQFKSRRQHTDQDAWYYPFHEPNALLTTPDQSVEIFAYLSDQNRHSVLIAIRDASHVGHRCILAGACRALRDLGVRYIEFLVKADDHANLTSAVGARFIPSAYFPAMQLCSDGHRHDFVVFSRSFETLDFRFLQVESAAAVFLRHYYDAWRTLAIGPQENTP